MMRYVYLPTGPMFERGECVSPATLLKVELGSNRPKGVTGQLYANETSGKLELYIGQEWVMVGKVRDYCVSIDKTGGK